MKYHLTPYQKKKIDEFFKYAKVGDYIYAGNLKSKIATDIKTAYILLEHLKEQGFLKNLYEIYCFDCNKSTGIFLNSPKEFPEDRYCDFCDKKLSVLENLIVLYKVIAI